MPNLTRIPFSPSLFLILSAVVLALPAQAATTVGRVVFATGNPVATDTAGTQRSLNRGGDVFAGDNLRTPVNSRLQVSFVDGAYISLQPDSEYEIEEYKYAGRPDGTESAVYRLLKGGVRAVTGLIGRENPEAYKVETAVATIGIRGTGHNSRICQGDCPNKEDGLYHNTWEGVTYVKNDVAEVNVPSGKGVFVQDLNSPIQFLNQPSSVTAVETAGEREEEQREEEEQTTIVAAGDQRTAEGDQSIIVDDDQTIVPTSSTVLLNNGLVGVLPDNDLEPGEEVADVVSGSASSIFVNDNGDIIGVLTLEDDDFGTSRVLATLDPAAVLGGDDAASVSEANTLLASADPVLVEQFRQNPATVAESFVSPDGVGWGRWTNGTFLVVDEDNITELETLVDNQSLHFIFGPEPPNIPAVGSGITGVYDFLGGTRSTSASGTTIGDGVIDGLIFINFDGGNGEIFMDVMHAGINYQVDSGFGNLTVSAPDNEILDVTGNVTASTSASGSACNPTCLTFIDGGFAGPDNGSGVPKHLGIEYDIQETDVIMGVAGFGLRPPM